MRHLVPATPTPADMGQFEAGQQRRGRGGGAFSQQQGGQQQPRFGVGLGGRGQQGWGGPGPGRAGFGCQGGGGRGARFGGGGPEGWQMFGPGGVAALPAAVQQRMAASMGAPMMRLMQGG